MQAFFVRAPRRDNQTELPRQSVLYVVMLGEPVAVTDDKHKAVLLVDNLAKTWNKPVEAFSIVPTAYVH